jgi:hypothetical protein
MLYNFMHLKGEETAAAFYLVIFYFNILIARFYSRETLKLNY